VRLQHGRQRPSYGTIWPSDSASPADAHAQLANAQQPSWGTASQADACVDVSRQAWITFCVATVDALWHARPLNTDKLLHVFANNTLTCVFDAGDHSVQYCLLPPQIRVGWHASWRPRAAVAPPYFEEASVWDFVWTWAQHSPEALASVPAEFRTGRAQLRRLPRVSAQWIEPRHLRMFERFAQGPQSVAQWLEACATPQEARQICGDFAALYAVRCLQLVD
jgi:hypothetical protein